MSLLTDVLSGLLSATGATAIGAIAAAARRRLLSRRGHTSSGTGSTASLEQPRMLRRYTLLRTAGPNDGAAQYQTTRPTGTVITQRINGHSQRFELTDVPLGDGTYAAEPLDFN